MQFISKALSNFCSTKYSVASQTYVLQHIFHSKMYLRGQKMYLVNNVLENQIWAVPLLLIKLN